MATDRRTFLRTLAGVALAGPLTGYAAAPAQRLLSCRSNAAGEHFVSAFDVHGTMLMDLRLPGRGHALSVAPGGRHAVVFARRPGEFIGIIDLQEKRLARWLPATPGRHFYGHGVFSGDGRRLFVTENAYADGSGRIGVYDSSADWRRVGELHSHGVGPHELRLLGDGTTLVVANGGIRTHPERPRAKLNLADMRPNLAWLDSRDGRLLQMTEPPTRWHQLSIRHIDVTGDGSVAVAMQYEGPKNQHPPLVALARADHGLRLLSAPPEQQRQMRNYAGSVAFDADGTRFAVTSPRGGIVTLWSASGEFLGHETQHDVCGIAACADGLWLSDGSGGLRRAGTGGTPSRFADTRWDNHLVAL